MSDYLERTNGGTTFVGSDVNIFVATAMESALTIYAKTGVRVNRSYTPTAMLRTASAMTGKTFKRGQYLEAAEALRELIIAAKEAPCS